MAGLRTGRRGLVIEEPVLQRVLAAGLSTGADFAEVFAEDRRSTGAVLDDGKIEELSSGRDRGAGIRVVVGDSTGFAHTSDLSESSLLETAKIAAAAAKGANSGDRSVALQQQTAPAPNSVTTLPEDVGKARKVELLTRADDVARSSGGEITQVMARYNDSRRQILVANTDGIMSGDDQVKTLFSVSCVASGDTGMQTGRESVGRTVGFELFDMYDVEDLARNAAGRAITKLGARPAPSENTYTTGLRFLW
jgi:TldD protein